MKNTWLYHFGCGDFDNKQKCGNQKISRNIIQDIDENKILSLLGGKGAGLREMSHIGLPIPPGFTIITDICAYYFQNNNTLPDNFEKDLKNAINILENDTGKSFGSLSKEPLLISVRSGAKISMPGMMDTVLNLGMNDEIVQNAINQTNNPIFIYDSYRRFIEMYSSVVLNIPAYMFQETYQSYLSNYGISCNEDLTSSLLEDIIDIFHNMVLEHTGAKIESNPYKQLISAVISVIESWMSERAIYYRKINNITDIQGTAVNIQTMVFGNRDDNSATGVIFTRSPSTGDKKLFGEFLINAQGEDVVAGIRTPSPITAEGALADVSMQKLMPGMYDTLSSICTRLESHYHDMQDIEFTIESGKLYILQTRNAKRSAIAAVKIAVDMVSEGILTKKEALMRIDAESLTQLLHTSIDQNSSQNIICSGLPASHGAVSGKVVFSSNDAEKVAQHHDVILVRNDTSPEDIRGMSVSKAIITARGGMTSHAAVVTRGMGIPCVCGIQGIRVNDKQKYFTTKDGIKISEGDTIVVDGTHGHVLTGEVNFIEPKFSKEFQLMLQWADEISNIVVRTNAETLDDTKVALNFGAVGIGLCRTEHMFFDKEKIMLMRAMIIAETKQSRLNVIKELKSLQIKDFKSLFKVLNGKSINVRLLDPPLHEFLPVNDTEIIELSRYLNLPRDVIDHRISMLHEINPMLGHRGCRIGISYPEIYEMQIESLLIAIVELYKETNINTNLEIMIPLICDVKELEIILLYAKKQISDIENKYKMQFNIKIGSMIELPRAALIADKIAPFVDYFSFGTNDLTQTTCGVSRDDIGSFLSKYLEQKIFAADPFIVLDRDGVGQLIEIAIKLSKKVNANIKFGVCGEHAGNPESIDFFYKIGIDYISCSPYRIPIARIAVAQSIIKAL